MSSNIQNKKIIINALAQNRAEEFGFDLSKEFVLPPLFEEIDFQKSSKPKIFIGGRGCGKTMLLRYLSHRTSFSPSKETITSEDISNIGLYWKVDTHLVHQLQKRSLDIETWENAFEHIFTIYFAIEILESISSIANSKFQDLNLKDLDNLVFNFTTDLEYGLPNRYQDLRLDLEKKIVEFQSWLRNIKKIKSPIFFSKNLLVDLTKALIEIFPFLQNSIFNIYIDEYENLVEYQQEIINTWVKHSEFPLIFHLAMKRNAFRTKKTVGTENLSEVHDYRIHDLEEMPKGKKDFTIFSAEILLNRLQAQISLKGFTFETALLKNREGLTKRKNDEYQKNILSIINEIFPSISKKELANKVNDDNFLKNKLLHRLNELLKNRTDMSADDFFVEDDMRVTFVSLVLLHRDNLDPADILLEINKYREQQPNKFNYKTDWIQNNFVGAYLYFYSNLNRVCPLFTGFNTFCEMSNGNIRHLTELCYKTFLRASDDSYSIDVQLWNISIEDQAQAAEQASINFLNEIKTFGRYGNQLHTFINRLGALFNLAQRNPKQSEPEQNHFAIVEGNNENPEVNTLLDEAIKWSVLFEEKSTKKKSPSDPDFSEYIMNPIYAPYFKISYRKKRKLEINYKTLTTLCTGSLNDYENLLKTYGQKWNLNDTIKDNNLFTNLDL